MTFVRQLILTVVVLLLPRSVFAGDLDDFERGGGRERTARPTRKNVPDSDQATEEKSGTEKVTDLLIRVLEVNSDTHLFFQTERKSGDRVLPFARAEVSYQRVFEDTDGLNTRVELGYSVVGASFSFLQYWEHDPRDRQSQFSGAFLYRISASRKFRMDLSLGGRTLRGNKVQSGFEGGVLTGIYPAENWGFEGDGRWTDISEHTLHDYRIGGVFLRQYWNIRAGWRWQHLGDKTLHGPEFSVGAQW